MDSLFHPIMAEHRYIAIQLSNSKLHQL